MKKKKKKTNDLRKLQIKSKENKNNCWFVTCSFFDFLTFLFEKCRNELVVIGINLL